MSQKSIASYFHSRKRAAHDDACSFKNKVIVIDSKSDNLAIAFPKNHISEAEAAAKDTQAECDDQKIFRRNQNIVAKFKDEPQSVQGQAKIRKTPAAAKNRRCLKRPENTDTAATQPKIVRFTLAGNLSPRKKPILQTTESSTSVSATLFGNSKQDGGSIDRGMTTPTKEEQIAKANADKLNAVRNNLSFNEITKKVFQSSRLQELKASLEKLESLEESRQSIIKKNGQFRTDMHNYQQSDRAARILGKSLKPFATINLEVLSR